MTNPPLPPELHAELALALHAYATERSTSDERLRSASEQLCRHARRAGMTPEGMVIGLRRAFDTVDLVAVGQRERLRSAYEHLLAGCLKAYFDESQEPAAESGS